MKLKAESMILSASLPVSCCLILSGIIKRFNCCCKAPSRMSVCCCVVLTVRLPVILLISHQPVRGEQRLSCFSQEQLPPLRCPLGVSSSLFIALNFCNIRKKQTERETPACYSEGAARYVCVLIQLRSRSEGARIRTSGWDVPVGFASSVPGGSNTKCEPDITGTVSHS